MPWYKDSQWIGAIGQVLAAVATFAAVLVALKDHIFRRAPRLTIRHNNESKDTPTADICFDEPTGLTFHRLWVKNDGSESAKNVEVSLISITRRSDGHAREEKPWAMRLRLSFTWLYDYQSQPLMRYDELFADTGKHWDMALHAADGWQASPRLSEKEHFGWLKQIKPKRLYFLTQNFPFAELALTENDVYDMKLEIVASNLRKIEKRFVVTILPNQTNTDLSVRFDEVKY